MYFQRRGGGLIGTWDSGHIRKKNDQEVNDAGQLGKCSTEREQLTHDIGRQWRSIVNTTHEHAAAIRRRITHTCGESVGKEEESGKRTSIAVRS